MKLNSKFLCLLFGVACNLGIFLPKVATARSGHKAHEHGRAALNVAVEDKKVVFEFESPSESIYGFEHEAKTDEQKKTRDAAVQILKESVDKIFIFESKLGCSVTSNSVEPFVTEDDHDDHHKKNSKAKHSGEHSEVHAAYTATCKESPAGSQLQVDLVSLFPKLKSIKVQVVGDKSQGSFKLSKTMNKIKL
ncbi:MAG: DUF2796 domain-containing protein [Proteobacteria bacterium]|nr:DUF2796 domain-containing protein [Pseudomonadota bacterium]